MSEIEWTDKTWNPVIGCTRHSAACDNCYAINVATRFAGLPSHAHYAGTVANGDWTGAINRAPDHIFNKPLTTRKSTVWFVNSMSDIFHHNVSDDVIVDAFNIMNSTPRHQYQILTKRPQAALKRARQLGLVFTSNIWMGASVGEDKFSKVTVRALTAMKDAFDISTIFVSAEPLLEALPSLDVAALDWVIVGGESGTKNTVRAMDPQWARDIRDRCRAANTPIFFKQWGKFGQDGAPRGKSLNGHLLDGDEIFEMPATVYDAMPKPALNWTRVANNATVGFAALTPAERFNASSGRWAVEGDLTDDHVAAVAAKLSDHDVRDNPNWRASPADEERLAALLGDDTMELSALIILADLPERECRRLLRKFETEGRAVKSENPLSYRLPTSFTWLAGVN